MILSPATGLDCDPQLIGSAGAALQYNCLSILIDTLSSRLLKIPTMRLLDGFGLITPLPVTGEPPLASAGLCEIFGFELELSKSGRGQILEP